MANQPIPISRANELISAYSTYMTAHNVDMQTQTSSVSFTSVSLMAWLNKVMPNSDELRICMGEYPKGDANEGRTTVILWPYKNGQPAKRPQGDLTVGLGDDPEGYYDPFNVGQLNP